MAADDLTGKDEIGALAKPVKEWAHELKVLSDRYGAAIGDANGVREQRLAKCDVADKWFYGKEVDAFKAKHVM